MTMTMPFTRDAAPPLFEDLLGRTSTNLPADYLPHATCVAIAGEPILQAIGYRPGSYRPRFWDKIRGGGFRRLTYSGGRQQPFILQVRQCKDLKGKGLWVVERFQDGDLLDPSGRKLVGPNIYTLCAMPALLNCPIVCKTYQAATRLAEYCHPEPKPPIVGYWAQAKKQQHEELAEQYVRDLTRMGRDLPYNEPWVKRHLERMGLATSATMNGQ